MRVRLLLLVVVAAFGAVGPATAADRVVERGIVQSLDPAAVVLRALDGTEVTVPLVPETRYRLNGRDATLADIQPGLVAEAVTDRSGRAIVLRAFGRPGRPVERGVLVRLALRALVLGRDAGDTIRVPVNDRTAVWRGGRRVALRALRRGMVVEVVLAANGAARVVLVQPPPGRD